MPRKKAPEKEPEPAPVEAGKKSLEKEPEPAPVEAPIVLTGTPKAMRGQLYLHNPGEARMIFRGAQLRSEKVVTGKAAAKAAKPLEQLMVSRKIPAAIVKPGERRRVPLRFALDPTTPPGEYRASLEMANQSWPLVFLVAETIALSVSPGLIVIHNQPGATATKFVVLSNDGNVDLDINDVTVIPLDDELAQCRILRGVSAVIGAQEESDLDHILTEFAHQSKAVLDQAGLLRVRNRSGSFVLQPGEVRQIELEIRLPDTLDKRTRYIAILPIYTANLTISLVPAFDEIQATDKPRVN